MKNTKDLNIELLVHALLSVEGEEECLSLLLDLCSPAEIEEMSRRMRAAEMLASGAQYADVVAQTGLSTATISRVSRSLKNGKGYSNVLKKIK